MFMEERQRQIAEQLQKEGRITIAQIAELYGISDESARRDLRLLEKQGLCTRTHGGAVSLQPLSVRPPADRCFENMPVLENYRAIAKLAAGMIRKNDTVYLTSGSLGYRMLPFLPHDFFYTLVVNSVDLAKELRSLSNADVYVAGGKMRPSGSMVDSLASSLISAMHFDLCFLTGLGFTVSFGLSNGTAETAAFQRAVLQNSRQKCLLIPGVKIGTDSFIKVCDAPIFSTVITDSDCPHDQLVQLKEACIPVLVALEEA